MITDHKQQLCVRVCVRETRIFVAAAPRDSAPRTASQHIVNSSALEKQCDIFGKAMSFEKWKNPATSNNTSQPLE